MWRRETGGRVAGGQPPSEDCHGLVEGGLRTRHVGKRTLSNLDVEEQHRAEALPSEQDDPLFRKEATDFAFRKVEGSLLLDTPLTVKILGSLIIATIIAGLVFIFLGNYARKETVVGWVVPPGGIVRVIAPRGGLIETLGVTEGAQVKAGASVAQLRFSSDIGAGDVGTMILEKIDAQFLASLAETQTAYEKVVANREALQNHQLILERQLEEAKARLILVEQALEIEKGQLERYTQLADQGFLGADRLDDAKRRLLAATQSLSNARSQVADFQRGLDNNRNELARIPLEMRTIQAQSARAEASLNERRVGAESQSLYGVQTPVAGTVVALPVELGQTLGTGQTVAIVAPASPDLLAELYVPSRAVGFIKPGQDVRLMYQSFPYQKYGVGRGVIQSISKTVLAANEVSIPGLTINEPVFKVRVKLDKKFVKAYNEEVALQPGMLLTAEIIVDRRSFVEWILDPLYAAGARR